MLEQQTAQLIFDVLAAREMKSVAKDEDPIPRFKVRMDADVTSYDERRWRIRVTPTQWTEPADHQAVISLARKHNVDLSIDNSAYDLR